MTDKVAVILQARTGSSRLPGKVLADLAGRPMLAFLVERLRRCPSLSLIILATTELVEDDHLVEIGRSLGLKVVRGSQHDVLSRFALAVNETDAQVLVRITGDCPFVDPELLEEMIQEFCKSNFDYLSNCVEPTYPDGLDVEIFTRSALLMAQSECSDSAQREHVTPWMRESGYCLLGHKRFSHDYSSMRWTVDEPEDLQVVRGVVSHFAGRSDFSWQQVLELAQKQPQLFSEKCQI